MASNNWSQFKRFPIAEMGAVFAGKKTTVGGVTLEDKWELEKFALKPEDVRLTIIKDYDHMLCEQRRKRLKRSRGQE